MDLEIEIDPLDLDLTLGCGQTFRWRRSDDGSWSGPLGRRVVALRMGREALIVSADPGGRGAAEAVATHLRAWDDIGRVQRALSKDKVLGSGIRSLRGLRIVKMDEWECLVSFALATYANIPRISKMIGSLAAEYGDRIAPGVHAFPDHAQLSKASARDLRRLGLGYRADHVKGICECVDADALDRMTRMGTGALREELMALPGVGDKVADCVSLFGFGRLEAFPIDVWMERALKRLYGQEGSYRKLREFASERFGPFAGYAQEYMYMNERGLASGGVCAFSQKGRE